VGGEAIPVRSLRTRWQGADLEGDRSADGIPLVLAARCIQVPADLGAAILILAACQGRCHEARSKHGVSAGLCSRRALAVGVTDAQTVPSELAAVRVDAADLQAARFIVAGRKTVNDEARVNIDVAARRTECAGIIDTLSIPNGFAAERIDRTDLVAACRVIAAGREVLDQAAPERGDAQNRLTTGCLCALKAHRPDTRLIPAHRAAECIDAADPIAALLVAATNARMRCKTISCVRCTTNALNGNTQVSGAQGARKIPLHLAAIRILVADDLAAPRIVAKRRWVGLAALTSYW